MTWIRVCSDTRFRWSSLKGTGRRQWQHSRCALECGCTPVRLHELIHSDFHLDVSSIASQCSRNGGMIAVSVGQCIDDVPSLRISYAGIHLDMMYLTKCTWRGVNTCVITCCILHSDSRPSSSTVIEQTVGHNRYCRASEP